MASSPFAHEDLEKLKKFIEFVSANPLILNMPQLEFVRKFIQQFGGTIPVGEFQMPAGGKCPFGGDAKAESKSCPHPPPPTQPEEDVAPEAAAEEESEESEVELDMEEINVQLLEPNVLYLDEKPPKIFKNKKAPKRGGRSKKLTRKKVTTKVKKSKKIQGTNDLIKKEFLLTANEIRGHNKCTSSGEDPLCTPEKEIKMETDLEHSAMLDEIETKSFEHQIPNDDIKEHSANEHNKGELSLDEDQEEYETKLEEEEDDEEGKECEDDDYNDAHSDSDDDYEDEPLIMLTRSKGRPRKDNAKHRMPRMEQCRDICKHRCTQKFTEEQRRWMCESYWSLTEDEKLIYIRNHLRTKCCSRFKPKKTTNRGNSCCYYLEDSTDTEGPNLVRVCRKYFEATLNLKSHTIKKALQGYKPEPEIEMKPLLDQRKELDIKENKSEVIQQYLDPETGNLVTIDPKAKKIKKPCTTNVKTKRVRRKPGDPLPERNPKPIKCAQRCIQKCHTKFTEEERKQICDIFWSMDYKRRKDYILARIETKDIETLTTPEFRKSNRPPRTYHTRFFLGCGINGENKRVCKHFMMSTLCISRMFITNAIDFADKNTGCYTGADRRGGHNTACFKIRPEDKQTIQDHISSYPTWIPNKKSKTRYLHHTLNIKRMHTDYTKMCVAEQKEIMSISYYYKSFHQDFSLSFLAHPEPKRRGGLTNVNPNISHYTGLESGGIWLDPKGGKLDQSLHNPAESFICFASSEPDHATATAPSAIVTAAATSPDDSICSVAPPHPLLAQTPSFSFNQSVNYAHLIDPALSSTSFMSSQPPVVRQEFNPNLYDSNLPPAHAASTSSLYRRL